VFLSSWRWTLAKLGLSLGLSLSILFAGAGPAGAAELAAPGWEELVEVGRCADAESLCSGWLASVDVRQKTEAHECLAQAALCGRGMKLIGASRAGRRPIAVDFLPGAVDKALGHLNEALKLSPQELAIHQKRLQLLEISSRFAEMAQALDESCRTDPAPKALDTWLSYVTELVEARQPQAALSLLTVLNRHFPKDPRVLRSTETVLNLLQTSPKR